MMPQVVHADAAVVTGVVIPPLHVGQAAGRSESVYDLLLIGMTHDLNRTSEPRKSPKSVLLHIILEWFGA